MSRLVIMTVGKTHSGKSTFAKLLEKKLANSVVIDQDTHAEFLKTNYQRLLPKSGTNHIKHALTKTIVEYAIQHTDCHLIISNANLNQQSRMEWLNYYHLQGFVTVLVHIDSPDQELKKRIANTRRNSLRLRTATSYMEVLTRQNKQIMNGDMKIPTLEEADYLLTIANVEEVEKTIQEIINVSYT